MFGPDEGSGRVYIRKGTQGQSRGGAFRNQRSREIAGVGRAVFPVCPRKGWLSRLSTEISKKKKVPGSDKFGKLGVKS